jgi:hypothetical protein
MGYRSDVAYVVKFFHNDQPEKAFADYIAFQDWVKNKHTISVSDASTPLNVTRTHTYVNEDRLIKWSSSALLMLFEVEDVKWYDSFADVKWHQEVLKKANEYYTGNYKFVRIGEDYNDVEVDEEAKTYFEMWEILDVRRSAYLNVSYDCFDEGKNDE